MVRLLEDTPRDRCFDVVVAEVAAGLSQRGLLESLLLAAVRQPHWESGKRWFWMHSIFGLYPTYRLSLDSPANLSLLPLLFAVDNFKQMQGGLAKAGGGETLPQLPEPRRSWSAADCVREFQAAQDEWDGERAEIAAVGLVRNLGTNQIIDAVWRYGARDFRQIGHKAIYATSVCRILETVGWQNAEPVIRSLVRGMQNFGPQGNVEGLPLQEQEYKRNLVRARNSLPKLPAGWTLAINSDEAVVTPLLRKIRDTDAGAACNLVCQSLEAQTMGAPDVFTAVHTAAAELMICKPGLGTLHVITSANAIHHAYRVCEDPELRLLLLLQAVAWACHFDRHFKIAGASIDDLEPATIPDDPVAAAQEILAAPRSRKSAEKALAFGRKFTDSPWLLTGARRLLLQKSEAVHDYKFLVAVSEDVELVAPAWRPYLLAAGVYWLKGADDRDSSVMQQANEALARL